MPRFAVATKIVGAGLVLVTLAVLLWSVSLQFHLERTDATSYQSSVGRRLFVVSWIGIPLGAVAVLARRDVGVAALAVGVLLLGFTVGQAQARLHPEAGERRAAAAFVPPAGAVIAPSPFDGYHFPSLRRTWSLEAPEASACAAAVEALRQWSDQGLSYQRVDDTSCFASARRGGHEGTVQVRDADRRPATTEIALTVTRRV